MRNKEYMKDLIMDYLPECPYGDDFNCCNCDSIEECYLNANIRCNDAWAESINYGGYSNAEEFWDNL